MLESVTVEVPEPGMGEVLVQVHAASVNPVDGMNRQTRPPCTAPIGLKWDGSGWQVKVTLPWSTWTSSMRMWLAIGAPGSSPGARQRRRGQPREVPARAAPRWQGHRDRRSTGPGLRPQGLVADGLLRPVVGEVFPFDRTPQAVQAQTSGGRRGKVVVTGT